MRAEVLCQVDGCDRPMGDLAMVCTSCSWRLEKALGNVSAFADELDTVLARQTRYEEHSERTNGGRVTPLFFDDRASEAGWVLKNTLSTWVRLVAEERGRDLPADMLAAMAGWLLAQCEWLRHHRAGHEAVEEITAAVWEVARVIDRPANRATFLLGACPDCETGQVRVCIPAQEDRPATMVCGGCDSCWDSTQLLRLSKRIVAAEVERIRPYVSSSAAAVALGVSDRTIRRWIVAGHLTNYGTARSVRLDLDEVESLGVGDMEAMA